MLESLNNRCATCKYWQGDKEMAAAMFAENITSMDLFEGWPSSGGCGISYEWLSIDIYGDASVSIEVDANFGCPYWEA